MKSWEKKDKRITKEQQIFLNELKDRIVSISCNFSNLSKEKQEVFIKNTIPSVCSDLCDENNCKDCLVQKLTMELNELKKD